MTPTEPWMLRAYLALKAAGKPQYYLLLGEDEVQALAEGVVLARTAVQAREAMETLEELGSRVLGQRRASEAIPAGVRTTRGGLTAED